MTSKIYGIDFKKLMLHCAGAGEQVRLNGRMKHSFNYLSTKNKNELWKV